MLFTEGWRLVCCFIILIFCAILCLDVRVWPILRLTRVFVTEYSEGLCHIPQHQQVNLAVVVVPVHIQYQVALTIPVAGYFVALFKYGNEALGVLLSDVLDTELINA